MNRHMEIRQMATAFLTNGNDMLMMKKAGSKLFNFEFWGGIGGHLEQHELNAPMLASYREIEEETGFAPEDIVGFRLRYILLGLNGGEIRQQFVYFGETTHRQFVNSEEGELFWIPQTNLHELHTSILIDATLKHALLRPDEQSIWIGTAIQEEGLIGESPVSFQILDETNAFA